jgi:SIR2-like domain
MPRTPPPYDIIADDLNEGHAIPFFGAAASAVYHRALNEPWQPGKRFLPFGHELAANLASVSQYPVTDNRPPGLAVVASFMEYVQGHRHNIESRLHRYFSADYDPGELHHALAKISGTKLYVTTNYDDLLEKALAARKPHIIVDRGERGLWVQVSGGAPQEHIEPGKELRALVTDPESGELTSPIVFKLHGSVAKNPQDGSYLITEEDYVDFLGRGDTNLPAIISSIMTRSRSFLFLGYSLADWNVRVILHKILKQSKQSKRIWAIVNGQSEVEQELWEARDLNIHSMDLQEFAVELKKHL